MKFVMFGLMGFIVIVIIAYLWFVPIHEIAEQFVVGYGIAVENIGAQFGLKAPRNYEPKPPTEEPARSEVNESRIPYPRPRRRSTSGADSQQAAVAPPTDSIGAASDAARRPAPTLRVTTIEAGAVQQTEVYVDTSGEKTVVRVQGGEVVHQVAIPER